MITLAEVEKLGTRGGRGGRGGCRGCRGLAHRAVIPT